MLTPARSQGTQFVLKDIPSAIHSNYNDLVQPHLVDNRYLRLPCDSIPSRNIFVYEYSVESLLSFSRRSVPVNTRMQILQAASRCIAELHSRDIVHLGQYVSRRCCHADDQPRRETGLYLTLQPQQTTPDNFCSKMGTANRLHRVIVSIKF